MAQHMDARSLEYDDECFDAVFSSSSLEHFGGEDDVARAIDEMFRVLRPGGVLTLSTELRLAGPPPGPPGVLLFDDAQLRELVVGERGWDLMSPLSARRLSRHAGHRAAFRGGGRGRAARRGATRRDPFPRAGVEPYPHIVLRDGERAWTSVHLALRKRGAGLHELPRVWRSNGGLRARGCRRPPLLVLQRPSRLVASFRP